MVKIYTDGAASGNPGPGGYGIVMLSDAYNLKKEFSQGYRHTTNNRMELLAVIVALEQLKHEGTVVEVYSDSSYVVNAVEKGWLFGWLKKGFKGKKNEDLWRRFYAVYQKHKVKLVWVRGHNGDFYNERCDQLATNAYATSNLLVDAGYEQASK